MASVLFRVGTREQYDALESYDSNTLYFLIDTQELFKGDVLFVIGAEATENTAGLLSAEDKAALDALILNDPGHIEVGDSSITMIESGNTKTINVALSEESDNQIGLQPDGLYVPQSGITEFRIGNMGQPIINGMVNVPLAGLQEPGVIFSSRAENKIFVGANGTAEVYSLNVNRLTQTPGDTLIIDGNF